MAFAQGTANGQIALLQALESFAVACGWTVEYAGVARDNSSDRQTMLSHVRGATTYYYSFVSRVTLTYHWMQFLPHGGINTANSIFAQPHSPAITAVLSVPKTAAFEYFFFGTAQYIAIVARMGVFHKHAFIGQIDRVGGDVYGILSIGSSRPDTLLWDRGQYNDTAFQSYHTGYTIGGGTITSWGNIFRRHDNTYCYGELYFQAGHFNAFNISGSTVSTSSVPSHVIVHNAPKDIPQNAAAILCPLLVFPRDPSNALKCRLAGTIPGVFSVNMLNHFSGKEITIGSDTYVIFPHWWTGGESDKFHPQTGYAFKKEI